MATIVPKNIVHIQNEAVRGEGDIFVLAKTSNRALSWPFRLFFGLASMVSGLSNIAIKQLLLPAQVSLLDPAHTYTVLAIITSAGALVGMLTTPLAGALSDRTTLRWGRRRSWLIFGMVFVVVGLILMGRATTFLQLLIGELITQIAVNSVMPALVAIIPDQMPSNRRALASAFVGMGPVVGGVLGLVLVARFTNANLHPQQGYYIMAGASCVCILLFLVVLRDRPLPHGAMPPFRLSTFLAGFWLSPRKHPDFFFTWLSRCLIFLGYTILVLYVYLYLKNVLHYASADKGVAIFQGITTGALVIAAIVGGIAADRLRRIKLFVSGAALIMVVALLLIAFIPSWPMMLVAAVILGLGFGIYMSVDIVLAVSVLPTENNSGKDLGIINTAIYLPLILSPVIGASILNSFQSYTLLFAFAAGCCLLAALLILPIKRVR